MKILKEYVDGFRWVDGDTSSIPFEKDSDLYNEKLAEGFELELMPQSEKDAHEQEQARATFKTERAQAVEALTIETALGVFDADERSQDRMARAVVAMGGTDTIEWVLNNNTVVTVTAEQLQEALQLAGAAQSALWTQ